ncbi:hypothetical protein SAMN02583745_02733 [Thorsellia anophelis DSM 18579]|uniref:Transposase DDE domain-containing protein n=1 Tax=Thorsellia anophelis DSM 18579 TaxID=1123402 RepID=A0A1I0FFW7_9GAMM|nr:hypothetical protein SAMN02583745_02733 [Thorsellia anophelis DSM 18579]
MTLDALHCQTETVNEIVKGKGIALIQVKGNQRKLYEAIDQEFQTLCNQEESEKHALVQDYRGHDRIEQSIDAKLNKDLKEKWPHNYFNLFWIGFGKLKTTG